MALASLSNTNWYWTGNTDAASVATADIDGDGVIEIISGGYYSDGTRYIAQLSVWSSATFALEGTTTWYWTGDTLVTSVAVGNVDADPALEIVTAGYYNDGLDTKALLQVWNGATLALEGATSWIWTSNNEVWGVAIGDVDGDLASEIVTVGSYSALGHDYAQLNVWDGATLASEKATGWTWGSVGDEATCVAVGNIDADPDMEIVTGSIFTNDGVNYQSLMHVWNGVGPALAVERVSSWLWGSDTEILSVAIGNVDGDVATEVVTGAIYIIGTTSYSQLHVWDGSTLAVKTNINWTSLNPAAGGTELFALAIGNVDTDVDIEIATAGTTMDITLGKMAEVAVWNGATLAQESTQAWQWGTSTHALCVSTADIAGTTAQEIITGGAFFDGLRWIAQLQVWG